MYPNRNGDEYYDTNSYKLKGNQEIYAQLKDGTQYYLRKNGFDVLANFHIGTTLVPYFALDASGHPICPRLKQNMTYIDLDIFYPRDRFSNELYPKLDDTEYYTIGYNGECQYAKKNNGKFYYAKTLNENNDVVEYPIVNKDGTINYIIDNDKVVYPKNYSNSKPIYFVDLNLNEKYAEINGEQIYAQKRGKQIYAMDNKGHPIYAKNNKGDDILAKDNNIPFYAFQKNDNGRKYEHYPTLVNKKQYYLNYDDCEVYAKKFNQDEYYAKDENENEYLANKKEYYYDKDKNEYLADKNNVSYYAKTHTQNEYYPKLFNIKPEKMEEIKKSKYINPSLHDIITHKTTIIS